MEICEYGCGTEAKHVTKSGKNCCEPTFHKCAGYLLKLRKKALKNHSEGKCYKFTEKDRKKSNAEKKIQAIKNAFVKNSTYSNEFIKPRFIELYIKEAKCSECHNNEWLGKPINLELDHIDGDNRNNEPSNLRLLCPNCHSYTETYRGKNINNGLKKVSDEAIIEAFKIKGNIRQTLLHVGLTPKGANYERVKRLIN